VRFHNSGTRGIDLNGKTFSTGGILVTSAGNGPTSIANGTLTTNSGANLARQDLVFIQNNTTDALAVDATISDNGAAVALTKSGPGVLRLTGANTYSGVTVVNDGILELRDAAALGSGNLIFKGGVIGLTAESGDFTRALGIAAGEVRWYGTEGTSGIGAPGGTSPITGGSGGFAAYGGTRAVNLGGSSASVRWGNTDSGVTSVHFLRSLSTLLLGADNADGTVDFQNPINLYGGNTTTVQMRTVEVRNGSAAVDAKLSGALSSNEAGLVKTGAGTLELSAANTYRGPTGVNDGELLVSGSLSSFSDVSVESDATLGGSGTVAGAIVVKSGGTISPGGTADRSLDVGSLTLAGGSTSLFDITGPGDGSGANADEILASGAVTFGGVLELNFGGNYGDGAWDLFDFATSAGDFASINDVSGNYVGLNFDPSTGILSTSPVPEPGAVGLLALGGIAMLVRRRRAR
jgi:autotransporter-associated beta strand protein